MELPGSRWAVSLEYRNISEPDARALKAFFAKLRGMAGRFYCHDFSHPLPAGTASGIGKVKGTSQAGSSLVTDNWPASQPRLFAAGDYFTVNGELKIITQTVSSDSSGEATLVFEPPLRSSPADNADVVTSSPAATFRLASDDQDQITFDPDRRPTIQIEAVEVFS